MERRLTRHLISRGKLKVLFKRYKSSTVYLDRDVYITKHHSVKKKQYIGGCKLISNNFKYIFSQKFDIVKSNGFIVHPNSVVTLPEIKSPKTTLTDYLSYSVILENSEILKCSFLNHKYLAFSFFSYWSHHVCSFNKKFNLLNTYRLSRLRYHGLSSLFRSFNKTMLPIMYRGRSHKWFFRLGNFHLRFGQSHRVLTPKIPNVFLKKRGRMTMYMWGSNIPAMRTFFSSAIFWKPFNVYHKRGLGFRSQPTFNKDGKVSIYR